MTHKVSVVIPVYNGEAFIARAIESVLNQTITVYEIIVINDGSRDQTEQVLESFKHKVNVISIPNGGVSNARNLGIKKSTGEFIAFLDADDVWYPEKIEKQLKLFDEYPDTGFSCCNYLEVSKFTGANFNHFSRFQNSGELIFDQPLKVHAFEALLKQNFVGTCSNVIIKREVVNKVGFFDTTLKQAEDYEFWFRCSLVTTFLLQSEVLLEKKAHDSNLTNNFLETLSFHEQVLINLSTNDQTQKHILDFEHKYLNGLAHTRYEIGNLLYESNQKIKAFKYFVKGLFTNVSLANIYLFSRFFGRKLVRTLSFNFIKSSKP